MLSTTSEYALRMMILLTEPEGDPTHQNPMTCAKLAEAGQIPQQYASKVLNQLRRAGMVKGQRGRYGGFLIGCNASTTTLLDVVNVIEPLERITECPLGRSDHSVKLCPLHSQLDSAIASLESSLAALTLRQIVDNADDSPLCRGEAGVGTVTVGGRAG